ncbi:neuroligin-1, partial [Halyomorpha halys]|uniref:neuroligin-1 n=1 Tax=Halyomorpha halys TaxID=286706 RepID=UPI0006D5272B
MQSLRCSSDVIVNREHPCVITVIVQEYKRRKKSGARGVEAPYAVMVYIHGESFDWNSGNHYDGSVLASFGHVIFITVNYRLGVFGFLKTGSDWPPAAGDISLALSWIKENIESFGGDPRRISIIGHDTGASLANLLLISPQAKGLFSRAILTSGSLLSPWGTGQDPGGLRLRLAAAAGCRIEPLACLRALPPSSLTALRVPAPRFLTAVGPWVHGEAASAVEVAGDPFLSSRLMIGTTTTESFLDFNSHEIQYGIEEDQRNRVLRTYVRNAYDYHLNEIFSTV